jgi:DNA adenine methylase
MDTSNSAAVSIGAVAQQMRLRVLQEIANRGGLTCDEVEEILDMRHQTISPRVNELMKQGLISDSGLRRKTRSGHEAAVWVVADKRELTAPLKWAGGKRTLLPRLVELYTPHRHRRLVEPFIGGMNVALGLRPERALLADTNPHLINFYHRLRNPQPITLEMRNSEHLYYAYRKAFNEITAHVLDGGLGGIGTATAAELFYYLNRTCFNGLCRFNDSGEFNVPFGKYKTINYRRDFSDYSTLLKSWSILWQTFDVTLEQADKSDFVYVDPPYDGTFVDYSKDGFTWEQQVSLARRLSWHKGPVIASNAATARILALYNDLGFAVETISSKRSIAANGDRADALEMFATKNLKGVNTD